MIGVDRLGKEVGGTLLHGSHSILDAPKRCHHDHRDLGVELLCGTQHSKPVTTRQSKIGKHNGRTVCPEGRLGLGLVGRFYDRVAPPF